MSWEPVCRVLAVILAIADNPRSGAGRVGLLLGGAIEALMPCLGLPRPEVIRSALEVRTSSRLRPNVWTGMSAAFSLCMGFVTRGSFLRFGRALSSCGDELVFCCLCTATELCCSCLSWSPRLFRQIMYDLISAGRSVRFASMSLISSPVLSMCQSFALFPGCYTSIQFLCVRLPWPCFVSCFPASSLCTVPYRACLKISASAPPVS